MVKYVIIKADTNDADYVTSKYKIIDEDVDLFRKVAEAIKSSDKYGAPWGKGEQKSKYNNPYVIYKDLLTEEEIDAFNDYCPSGEYSIHSIESIEIIEVINEERLL